MNIARACLLVSCLLAAFLAIAPTPAKAAGSRTVATWIWQTGKIHTEDKQILSFARKNRINLLYLQIDRQQPSSTYREFIRKANQAGIEVHALGGDPSWGLASGEKQILEFVHWVEEYNNTVDIEERIKGIHLDIKPYLLSEWGKNRNNVINQWTSNIASFERAANAAGIQAGVDIPVWLDNVNVPNENIPLSQWMIQHMDQVTLLAYRDTVTGTNGITNLIENELKQADELNKSVVVAVNMKKMPEAERHTTFYGQGIEGLKKQLLLLKNEVGSHHSFAGYAIHDYKYWLDASQAQGSQESPIPFEPLRATYIWQAELAISEPDDIIAFCRENQVNLLYVRLDIQQPYSAYRDFVGKARKAGIQVQAMGGHPVWALEKNLPRVLSLVNYVKAYNQQVADNQRFQGIHLDIEPYVMSEWYTDQETVIRQWVGNIDAFVREVKQDSSLEASADLAFWLDKIELPGDPSTSISKWMIEKLDHVTIMAFRDHAEGSNGIASLVSNELNIADQLEKKIIVAVEMKASQEASFVTFYDKGKTEMEKQLALLSKKLGKYPSYVGNAVHAYDYWKYGKE